MSPQAGLSNDIFLFYMAVAAGLLLVAGVVIAVMRWGLRKNMDHAWNAYRGWLLMVPLLCVSIFLGREAAITFFTIVAIFGFKEFARATGLYNDWLMTGTVYLGILATGLVSLVTDPVLGTPGWYGIFIALPVFVIALILIIPILRNETRGQLQAIALAMVGFIYLGWMFGHLAFLANSKDAYSYVLYLIFAVELNDVAAFTFGKLFGRRKLRSNISPNKTWGGSLGAFGVSMLLPWILHFALPQFQARERILTGLIVGIGGQMGDLSISVIKRDLGVKDMGAAIKGHGGILDRIDSLLYTAPLFFHMVRYW
jgi:phosphatidate cytidylyltransferase